MLGPGDSKKLKAIEEKYATSIVAITYPDLESIHPAQCITGFLVAKENRLCTLYTCSHNLKHFENDLSRVGSIRVEFIDEICEAVIYKYDFGADILLLQCLSKKNREPLVFAPRYKHHIGNFEPICTISHPGFKRFRFATGNVQKSFHSNEGGISPDYERQMSWFDHDMAVTYGSSGA